jgi:chemosensory pili system protein ChpA (sensor histidine kinase/response regulator)
MLHLPPHLQPEHEEDYEKALADRSVLILAGNERYALEVDSLVGQQEVVIKDLGSHLKTMPGLLGATILGNGQVVLILNIYELMLMAGIRTSTFASGFISGAVKKQTESPSPARLDPRKRGSTGLLSRPPVRSEEIFRQRRAPLIQVVDDSLSVRKVLSGMLEKAGFRVRTSKDGQEALETIHQQNAPDLFIMDIEMPRMDGYELTGIIKNSPHYRHIPVVMLTSRAGPKHRQKAEEVGADGFLVKPYKEEELLQIVGLLLSQSTRTN